METLLQHVPDPNKEEYKIRKHRLTVACYGALVTAYGNAGEWEMAAEIPHRMCREGKKPNTDFFNTFLSVAAKHVRYAHLLLCLSSVVCASSACHRRGCVRTMYPQAQWRRAEAAMDTMRALGVKPNRQTYNTLTAAYGHAQQWERAEAMLRDAAWQGTGLERDHRTYNAFIAACERADTPQWERAEVSGTPLLAKGKDLRFLAHGETRLRGSCHNATTTHPPPSSILAVVRFSQRSGSLKPRPIAFPGAPTDGDGGDVGERRTADAGDVQGADWLLRRRWRVGARRVYPARDKEAGPEP